jgi:hypothetical protein
MRDDNQMEDRLKKIAILIILACVVGTFYGAYLDSQTQDLSWTSTETQKTMEAEFVAICALATTVSCGARRWSGKRRWIAEAKLESTGSHPIWLGDVERALTTLGWIAGQKDRFGQPIQCKNLVSIRVVKDADRALDLLMASAAVECNEETKK